MPFHPKLNENILIEKVVYRFSENPLFKNMVYGQTGRRATVYQIRSVAGDVDALKVFTVKFRTARNMERAERLRPYANLPGLQVCERVILNDKDHSILISRYPDLNYAVLMKWIEGQTWQEIILGRYPITPEQSLYIAKSFLLILAMMESKKIAHCDISGPNVLIPGWSDASRDKNKSPIELVDVEDLYAPNLSRPEILPGGSAGYAHRTAPKGLWSPEADRFAGAILLCEMLGWCDERVRQIAYGEQLFDPDEMQNGTERFQILYAVLKEKYGNPVAILFEKAWHSNTLEECPSFANWQKVLLGGEISDEPKPPQPKEEEETGKQAEKSKPSLTQPSIPPKPEIDKSKEESLEQLRTNLVNNQRRGNWKAVIEICDQILNNWPDEDNNDLTPAMIRARRLLQQEEDLNQSWKNALQTGQIAEWERCWQLANSLLKQIPGNARYMEISQQAEQEMEWTSLIAHAEGLVSAGKMGDAEAMLAAIPQDNPRAALLRSRIEMEKRKGRRIEELLEKARAKFSNRDWDSVILTCQTGVALRGSEGEFRTLLEKANNERDLDIQVDEHTREAEKAYEELDWQTALAQIGQAITLRPARPDLLEKQARFLQEQGWSFQLAKAEEALGDCRHDEALQLLTNVPVDYRKAGEVVEAAQRLKDLTEKINLARSHYEAKKLLQLLASSPTNYPQKAELVHWAEAELDRSARITHALQSNDEKTILNIIKTTPDDYPHLEDLKEWAAREAEHKAQIKQAVQSYDGERVLVLLANVPETYPGLADLRAWAEREILRRQNLEIALQQNDWPRQIELLQTAPEDYPDRAERLAQAQQALEKQNRRRIEELLEKARAQFSNRDWDSVILTCQTGVALGGQEGEFRELLDKASNERELDIQVDEHTREAEKAYEELDWQTALAQIGQAITLRPARPDLLEKQARFLQEQGWSFQLAKAEEALGDCRHDEALQLLTNVPVDYRKAGEVVQAAQRLKELTENINLARSHYEAKKLLQLLASSPTNYPQKAELVHWAEAELDRSTRITQALQSNDEKTILNIIETIPDDYPSLEDLKEWAAREVEHKAQIKQAVQSYDGEQVLTLLAGEPETYSGLADLRAWAEREILRRQNLEIALQQNDWPRQIELLQTTPEDYPDRAERLAQAQQALDKQNRLNDLLLQLDTAEKTHAWSQVVDISNSALGDTLFSGQEFEKFANARAVALQELDKDSMVEGYIQKADQAAGEQDWVQAQELLAAAQQIRPENPDLKQRVETVNGELARLDRNARAARALEEGRWSEAVQISSQASPEDLEAAQIHQEARKQWIADLYQKADAAEQACHWAELAAALQWLQSLNVPDDQLAKRLRSAQNEIQFASLIMLGREKLRAGQLANSQAAAQNAQKIYPNRPEVLSLFADIKTALRRQRRRRLILVAIVIGAAGVVFACMLVWGIIGGGPMAPLFPTATATATPTATATRTMTPLPTSTSTLTPTATFTSTITSTPTVTDTPTATHTPTGTDTQTPTITSTFPPTPLPTSTRTNTPTSPPPPPPPPLPTRTWTPPPGP